MLHIIVVPLHIVGALVALVAGFLALRFPNGTPRHRFIGKLYLISWATLAASGVVIGARRPQLSVFEILNILGFASVLIAYGAVLARKKLGRVWLSHHYNWMLTSMAFLCVATVNQVIMRLGITYPLWVFFLMVAAPTPIISWYVRRLDKRYKFKQELAKA